MNNSRKERRYSTCLLNPERAYIEIDTGIKIRGRIIDLSAGGLAFEVSGNEAEIRAVDMNRDYFIELIIDSLKIVSGVQKVWSIQKKGESGFLYLAGVRFGIISNDDRLKLYSVIERIRDLSLSGS